jgi:hypothetical protein
MPNKRGSRRSGAKLTAPDDVIVDSSGASADDHDQVDRAAGQMRVPGGMGGTVVRRTEPAQNGSERPTGSGNETVSGGVEGDVGIGQDRVKGGQG